MDLFNKALVAIGDLKSLTVNPVLLRQGERAVAEDIFNTMDENKDGVVTGREFMGEKFKAMKASMQEELSEEELRLSQSDEVVMTRADVEEMIKSGEIGKIAMAELKGKPALPPPAVEPSAEAKPVVPSAEAKLVSSFER